MPAPEGMKTNWEPRATKLAKNDPGNKYLPHVREEVNQDTAEAIARMWVHGEIQSPAEAIRDEIERLEKEDPNVDLFQGWTSDPLVDDYERVGDVLVPKRRMSAAEFYSLPSRGFRSGLENT